MSKAKRKSTGFSNKNNLSNKAGGLKRSQDLIKENQALTFFKAGNFKEAEKIYRSLIEQGSQNYSVYANLAQISSMSGKNQEIAELLKKAIELNPKYVIGYFNLANVLKIQGDINSAITFYRKAINLDPNFYDANFNLAITYQDQGDIEKAIISYKSSIRIKPNLTDAYINLGLALKSKGDLNSAIDTYEEAIKIQPQYPNTYINLGITLKEKGDLHSAILCFKKAMKIKPDYLDAYINLGNAFVAIGDLQSAIKSYQNAIKLKPNFPELIYNLANALQSIGNTSEAIIYYQKVIKLKPDYSPAYHNLGNAFLSAGDTRSAIKSYQNNIRLEPECADGYYNLGNAFRLICDDKSAIISYQQAIKIKPDYAPAYNNLASSFRDIGNYDEAIKCYQRAIELDPDCPSGFNNLGVTLEQKGDLISAIESHKKALDIDAQYISSIGNLVRLQRYVCDWIDFNKNKNWHDISGAIHPRDIMYLIDDPEIDLKIAKNFYEKNYIGKTNKLQLTKKERIRIGYFSADFREHPVSMLFTRILEIHDRSQFEIYAYDFGPYKPDSYTNRIEQAVDVYHDLRELTDEEIVSLAIGDRLDIAIDLMGYTIHNRASIYSVGVAPIQINYLGFSGSMGAKCIDYIIADKTLIPKDNQHHYTEKILYLNQSAMCCDDTMINSDCDKPRSHYQLPENGLIFTCFNNNYKISPEEFDIWMNLLSRINESYLWLKVSNDSAKDNLIKEAKKRGISSERLIFAGFVPFNIHLERYTQGDLFLDTFNYNAGSTAVITLLAGMPLLTLKGRSYHSRMSASLLMDLGLPELISQSPSEYEEKAYYYATNRHELKLIKEKLNKSIKTSRTFNSESFSKDLERLYKEIYFERINDSY